MNDLFGLLLIPARPENVDQRRLMGHLKFVRDTLNPLKGMSFLQITLPKTTYHFRDARTLLAAFGKLCKTTLACAQATTTPGLLELSRK